MKIGGRSNLLPLLFCSLLFSGFSVNAIPYDYSFTSECLKNPQKPLYGGGIVVNPELKDGLKGWTTFGDAQIEARVSKSGNQFVVSHHRNAVNASVSQQFFVEKEKLYTFSAWVQVSDGEAEIIAIFKVPDGLERAALTTAKSGCWSMLKGGFTVKTSGPAQLFFKTFVNQSVEIWVDSLSVQPFTQEEWKSHQNQTIEKVRKSKVKIQAVDSQGKPLANKKIFISQKSAEFPLGCAIHEYILNNTDFQNWFTSRFRYTTFGNEMKWYANEVYPNKEDYSISDAMLEFFTKHGISVRGHNVFWAGKENNTKWVQDLSPSQLSVAVQKRILSIMNRYSGQVVAWDVVNENIHFDYFESMLGPNTSANFFKTAHMLDPKTPLFLNDFNTLENPRDDAVYPYKYLAKIAQLRAQGYHGPLSIGLQGHFLTSANIPYMRAAIDILATSGLSIWLTEIDAVEGPKQAMIFEETLREAHSHPAVDGIVIWGAWHPMGCWAMCLTDGNFTNTATGDVTDQIIAEWEHTALTAVTNANGFFETSLFHGDYDVKFANSSSSQSFKVASLNSSNEIQQVKICA